MFEFCFKRKVLSKIVSVVTAFSLFSTIGFSNCLAIPEDSTAIIFSNYVMNKLDEEGESKIYSESKVSYEDFSEHEILVYKYDDREILKKDEKKELEGKYISERDVYKKIEKKVKCLTSGNNIKSDIDKASAIYEWVAKNIKYDKDSLKYLKPATQSAFCAFEYGKAVCLGYAEILQLMMRLAGIPCKVVSTIPSISKCDLSHTFNAIYLKDGEGRTGWTLIDPTWASSELRKLEDKKDEVKVLGKYFPAIDKELSFKDANMTIIKMRDHQIKCAQINGYSYDESVKFDDECSICMTSDINNLKLMYIPNLGIDDLIDSDSDYEDSDEKSTDKSKLSSDDEKNISKSKTSNQYNITISDEIAQFKTKIFFKDLKEVFKITKKVFVEGNVEIDFEECNKEILNDIKDKLDFTRSNIYKFDEENKNKVIDRRTKKEVFDFSKVVVENQ